MTNLFSDIKNLLIENNVNSILDCGCGICKLYPHILPDKKIYKAGIEINEEKIKILLNNNPLDKLYIGNFYDLIVSFSNQIEPNILNFDLILFFDSIEHLPEVQALEVLEKSERVGKKLIIIFTPADGFSGVEKRTTWDKHRSVWGNVKLRNLGYNTNIYTNFHKSIGGGDALLGWKYLKR